MMPASSLPPPVPATQNATSATNSQQSQLAGQMQMNGTQQQLNAASYPQLNANYNLASLANVDMSSFQGVSFL